MKKILYFSSQTGGGHKASAEAIKAAIVELKGKDAFAHRIIDVFAECSWFLNIFARLYSPVINHAPWLWGKLFYWLDHPKQLERLEKIGSPLILSNLTKLVKREDPAIIVAVHPLVNHLAVKAIKKIGRKIPIVTVITDPVTFHKSWVMPEVDRCIVATPEAQKSCQSLGMPKDKIKVIGLPIRLGFLNPPQDKKAILKNLGLKENLFTVLFMGGGEGMGKMLDLVKALGYSGVKGQIIAVAGRNRQLEKRLKKEAVRFSLPAKIFGFTDKIAELMDAADVVVTKAGPGTLAEALAKDLPVVIDSFLPGQEEGNARYVEEKGIGVVVGKGKEIVQVIEEWSRSKSRVGKMKENIRRIKNPQVTYEIAKEILRFA